MLKFCRSYKIYNHVKGGKAFAIPPDCHILTTRIFALFNACLNALLLLRLAFLCVGFGFFGSFGIFG
jgi:hypothetical protein